MAIGVAVAARPPQMVGDITKIWSRTGPNKVNAVHRPHLTRGPRCPLGLIGLGRNKASGIAAGQWPSVFMGSFY